MVDQQAKVTFVLHLLKEDSTRWAVLLSNDALLDNFQNFMKRFKASFDAAARRAITNQEISQVEARKSSSL